MLWNLKFFLKWINNTIKCTHFHGSYHIICWFFVDDGKDFQSCPNQNRFYYELIIFVFLVLVFVGLKRWKIVIRLDSYLILNHTFHIDIISSVIPHGTKERMK